jgi:non-homologous end joining protein Ku
VDFNTPKINTCVFTEDELGSLAAEAKNIDLKQFIRLLPWIRSILKILPTLGADKGGEKPYPLLADAMAKSDRGFDLANSCLLATSYTFF